MIESVRYGPNEPGLDEYVYTATLPIKTAMRLAVEESDCELIAGSDLVPLVAIPNSLRNNGQISFHRRGV